MSEEIKPIHEKLSSFKRKYYLNLFIRGSILTGTLLLAYFIIAALVEYNLWLSSGGRLFIFTSFFLLVAFCTYRFLKQPLRWWLYKKGLDEQQSARMVGNYFPTINDRLLNLIQLDASDSSELARAGIAQKSKMMEGISFDSAIDLGENKRYLKYFAAPFVLIAVLWVFNQNIFTQSTSRIVQFNREFSPEAPFQFQVLNPSLLAFFNEDFTLQVKLAGDALPDAVYLVRDQQRLKMEMVSAGLFSYTFERLQDPMSFQFEASGFYSDAYKIEMINRPELTRLKVELDYPNYLGRRSEQLVNAGNLDIPEGTKVTWNIDADHASAAQISFASGGANDMQQTDDHSFTFGKGFQNPDDYWIDLANDHAKNKDRISYSIRVIKDQYPSILVEHVRDSVLYKTIIMGGSISDDYGLTGLQLHYQIQREGNDLSPEKKIPLVINPQSNQQSFFYQWPLDSLQLNPGDKVQYFLQVTDNDGVNGRKSTKSAAYVFALPGDEELKAEISKSQSAAEGKIDQSINKAKELRESIEEAQQRLRGKQSMDWQDKKMLEDLIQQKQSLDKAIQDLQKENQLLEEKKEAFSEENERIREKSEQIRKLMDELLDEETKKMFEELEKLLRENSDMQQVQKMLDKMDRKEINLEKELERTLELFKQLQFDYKVDQAIQDLKEQTEKQVKLLEETKELAGEKKESKENKDGKEGDKGKEGENKNESGSEKENAEKGKEQENQGEGEQNKNEKLAEEQEKLTKEFEELEKSMEDLEKMGEELDQPTDLPSEQEKNELKDSQQQSKESLKQGQPKKSTPQQQKAVNQMKKMQEKMEGMQNSMQMEIDMQNLESLRQIVHGLIKLSFDQENLMKEFNPIQQTDPRYVQLGQNQIKIQDDAKVLEDSLLAVAKKDAFMGSVVTKEIGELNDHIDKAVENIKERRKGNASTEMQFSMTSINNLALMLKDHFDMMMQMMANAKPAPGKGKGKNKGEMNLGEMQQQLNNRMEQLKNGGKSGRALSEELAKMAAEQERIRRALQEMQEQLKKEGGKAPGGDLPGKMEQTELDLVNKQITEQTIRRQRDILTRLLETEKSMREQKMDDERKGETAKEYEKEIPRAFEEYLRLKEKEVELLKTVPPKLYPYYKKEVNDYFKRIGTQQ